MNCHRLTTTPIPQLSCTDGGRERYRSQGGKNEIESGKKGAVIGRKCFNFFLCFLPSNSALISNKLNYFSQNSVCFPSYGNH